MTRAVKVWLPIDRSMTCADPNQRQAQAYRTFVGVWGITQIAVRRTNTFALASYARRLLGGEKRRRLEARGPTSARAIPETAIIEGSSRLV